MGLILQIKSLRHKAYQAYCRVKPVQKNKILLWSDNFKSFGCSPKYIALYLAKQFPGKYDLVWVLEQDRPIPQGLPAGIRVVRYFSMEYLKEIATAKVIVCNHRMGPFHYFKKRKGQYYIQTWHSSLRLKKIEGDAPELDQKYVDQAKIDSENIDLLLSGCRFSSDIFRRAFWYDGEIYEYGTPRCDGFFGSNQAVRQKVFDFYGIPQNKKLALYAPTFRKDKKASLYGMDFAMLGQALGEDWVMGCRLHPNIAADLTVDNAIAMSKYPDMQELLAACDLLITDYSSSMFDMAVAGKQCALYLPDLKQYTAGERGLYFDIRSLPFPKGENMEEFCRCLKEFEGYQARCAAFLKEIGSFEDGNAAAAVAKRIEEICYG
jgi:CDP-glycerol glycerophosphotransferase